MPQINDKNVTEAQQVKISESIKAYSGSTGISLVAMDAEGKIAASIENNKDSCLFCEKLSNFTKLNFDCTKSHLYGFMQAQQLGGKYIYFCPTGMTFIASPLILAGDESACFIGGPIMMIDKEDYMLYDISAKYNLSKKQMDELSSMLDDVPAASPERVNMLSNLLFMVAAYVSGMDYFEFLKQEDENTLQSKISEIVQDIKSENKEIFYSLDKENDLLKAISEGDRATAGRLLNEILGHLYFDGGNYEIIKARAIELVVLLSRAAVAGGASSEQILGLNFRYLKEINSIRTIEQMSIWLTAILNRFTDIVFTFSKAKHSDIIYKTINYIKSNYMNKITLDEIAKHVYLSPSYLSKIFAEEMNCNFITYLNKIRIEKSKALLLSDDISLNDVAAIVGYDNQSYFSKVFKKMTGVSPGKFKETRGQVLNKSKHST